MDRGMLSLLSSPSWGDMYIDCRGVYVDLVVVKDVISLILSCISGEIQPRHRAWPLTVKGIILTDIF